MKKKRWEKDGVIILGHRGFSASYPENTLLSFREAISAGADGVELDVRLTRDNQVVVIHDSTIDRISSMSGRVRDMNLDEIRKADVGIGEKIPLLEEVLSSFPDALLNIEIKERDATKNVINLVEKYGIERVMLSSFDIDTLHIARSLKENIILGYLIDDENSLKDIESEKKRISLYSVNAPIDGALIFGAEKYRKILKDLKDYGLKIVLWPYNDDLYYKNNLLLNLLEFVDVVITDNPKRMIEYLREVL